MAGVQGLDECFDKLQEFLLAMSPGDHVSVDVASEVSGLDAPRCEAVLNALLRAGLLIRVPDDTYERCRLKQSEHQTT